jgi:hypothetical protein
MPCVYTINGKRYDEEQFKGYLRQMPVHEAAKFIPGIQSLPESPFKTTWPELSLKRMIRYAAEHGYEKVAWTPGSVQEARYWGHEAVAPAVARWHEITKPESIRELSENVLGGKLTAMMPLQKMEGGVLAALHHNEVRREVISRLPVDVVDDLHAIQSTPEQLLRDPDMIVSRLSADHRGAVANGLFSAISETGASLRAKLRNLEQTGREHLLTPALRASELNAREVAGLLDPQRLFHGGTGGGPERLASARSGAKPTSVGDGLVGGDELRSTELANLLNAHAAIGGNEGLLRQGVQPPPGEGMKGFYDQILPATVNKLVKKFGGRVEKGELQGRDTRDMDVPFVVRDRHGNIVERNIHDENFANERAEALGGTYEFDKDVGRDYGEQVHTLDITPQLAEAATEQGFPLFQGARGKIRLAEGQRPIVTLMKDANASTFIHESGHDFLEQMMRDSQHPEAPAQLRDDTTTLIDWLGVNSAEDIKRRQHENSRAALSSICAKALPPRKVSPMSLPNSRIGSPTSTRP